MKRLQRQLQLYGVQSLSTPELLAFVLSTSSKRRDLLALAARVLERFVERGLGTVSEDEYIHAGVSRPAAQLLQVACELGIRLALPSPGERPRLLKTEDAVAQLRPLLGHLDREEFRVLLLSTTHDLVADVQLYKGTVDSVEVRPAEVFREALLRNCPKVIVAHNHPSGDPAPSEEDYAVTRRLMDAGKLLDIQVVDHIIIGGGSRYVSVCALLGYRSVYEEEED